MSVEMQGRELHVRRLAEVRLNDIKDISLLATLKFEYK